MDELKRPESSLIEGAKWVAEMSTNAIQTNTLQKEDFTIYDEKFSRGGRSAQLAGRVALHDHS